MPFADRRLDELLAELQSWLLTLDSAPKAPTWSRVLLSEESMIDRSGARPSRPGLRSGNLKTPAEFAPRWQELVDNVRESFSTDRRIDVKWASPDMRAQLQIDATIQPPSPQVQENKHPSRRVA